MLQDGEKYQKPMAEFLNKSATRYNSLPVEHLDELSIIFKRASDLIWETLGSTAFRPNRPLNAAVFDSVMPAVAKRLIKGAFPKEQLSHSYNILMKNKDFMRASERGTSDEEAVKTRRRIASEVFDL